MSGPANKKRPSTHHLEAAEAKLPQKVHPKVPPTGAAKMRSTQAVPRSLGGAPARSTARPHPHPHQACGIQTETCTQGQRSCLLCHMPSEGRLTNKSQPARSKQVQPAQPARQYRMLVRTLGTLVGWRSACHCPWIAWIFFWSFLAFSMIFVYMALHTWSFGTPCSRMAHKFQAISVEHSQNWWIYPPVNIQKANIAMV